MAYVKLNHICHKKDCEGGPGSVIKVSDEDAKFLIDRGGAVVCDAKGNVPEPKEEPKPK